jgi:predicted 3-demethylubiquinone-9 3-methyltransferase (glyoxalase superfamily)
MQKITPHLWFDKEAYEAAKFYTSVFRDSKIKSTTQLHNTSSGTVELLTIELLGQEFTLISARPVIQIQPINIISHCLQNKG